MSKRLRNQCNSILKSIKHIQLYIVLLEQDHICSIGFIPHNPASVLHLNASVSTQNKMDQFIVPTLYTSPTLSSILSSIPNIPPLRVVCQSHKSSQGGFRQSAVTYVTTGAKSEHSGQRNASVFEIYTGGFTVSHLRRPRWDCSDVCFALVVWDVLICTRRGTCYNMFKVQGCNCYLYIATV